MRCGCSKPTIPCYHVVRVYSAIQYELTHLSLPAALALHGSRYGLDVGCRFLLVTAWRQLLSESEQI